MNESNDCLVQIVGGSPLPVLVTAATLQPSHVILIHSKESELNARQLKALYDRLNYKTELRLINDPNDATECRSIIKPDLTKCKLDYTGGTKVMSANIRATWMKYGGPDSQALYLDDSRRMIRFDDGSEQEIDIQLPLNSLLAVHGLKNVSVHEQIDGGPTESDSVVLVKYYLSGNFGKRLLQLKKKTTKKIFTPEKVGLSLSLDSIPPKYNKPAQGQWNQFFGSIWLEIWMGHLVKQTRLVQPNYVFTGVLVEKRNGTTFEIDVASVQGHRAHIISCSTWTITGKEPKRERDEIWNRIRDKLFEVMLRSKQFGGLMVRRALVIPVNEERVAHLEAMASELMNVPNQLKVFGLKDMKEWAGVASGTPNLASLSDWLKK